MAWIVLIISGLLEAVWATALGKSEGFTKLWPSVIFGVAIILSMGGLAWAMRDISTATAYAVWVGIGAALTRHRLKVLAEITSEVYYFANALNQPTIDLHAKLGFQELTTDFQLPGVIFSGGTGHLFRLAL